MFQKLMNLKAGRPRDPEKLESIYTSAKKLFLEQGYEFTSMDKIAAEASVSKQTIYRYFENKDDLLRAIIIDTSSNLSPDPRLMDQDGMLPKEVLLNLAKGFLDLMGCEDCASMHRVLASEMNRGSTEMAQIFHDAGPERMLSMLQNYLESLHKKKILQIDHFRFAAEHFFSAIKGIYHVKLIFGLNTEKEEAERDKRLESFVNLFLKGYAAD